MDLSDLPDGRAFRLEIQLRDATENSSNPILEKVTVSFEELGGETGRQQTSLSGYNSSISGHWSKLLEADLPLTCKITQRSRGA